MFYLIPNALLFFAYFLDSTICVYFNCQLLSAKINWKKSIPLGIILAFFWYLSKFLPGNSFIHGFFYLCLMVGGLHFLTISSIFDIFICAVLTSNLSLMLEYIAITTIAEILTIPIPILEKDPLLLFWGITLASGLILIFYLILKKYKISLSDEQKSHPPLKTIFFNKKDKKNNYSNFINKYYKIILIYIIQMRLLTLYFRNYDSIFMSAPIFLTQPVLEKMTIGIIIFFLNFITIFIIKSFYTTSLEQYQYKINELRISHLEEQHKIYQQYRHDLKNHMNIISALAKEKNYEKLINYFSFYKEKFDSELISINTGIKELDILLYTKINNAQAQKIKVDVKCTTILKSKNNNIIHLTSILGNLLDNAIEASEKSKDKLISISIKDDPIDYTFLIKNTFENSRPLSTDILILESFSTKGENRGYGLYIVNNLVKKLNGTINIRTKGNFFEVQVDLPKHELQ